MCIHKADTDVVDFKKLPQILFYYFQRNACFLISLHFERNEKKQTLCILISIKEMNLSELAVKELCDCASLAFILFFLLACIYTNAVIVRSSLYVPIIISSSNIDKQEVFNQLQ